MQETNPASSGEAAARQLQNALACLDEERKAYFARKFLAELAREMNAEDETAEHLRQLEELGLVGMSFDEMAEAALRAHARGETEPTD